MKSRLPVHWVLALSSILLSLTACQTIEHRSERLPKASLPVVELKQDYFEPVFTYGLTSQSQKKMGLPADFVVNAEGLWIQNGAQLVKLNPQNGQVEWSKKLSHAVTAGPSVGQGLVFVATEASEMVALDAKKGELVYQQALGKEWIAPFTLSQDSVYSQSLSDTLMAFNLRTGMVEWAYPRPSNAVILRQQQAPLLVGQRLVAGFSDGSLLAFDAKTGAVLWTESLSEPLGRNEFQRMVDFTDMAWDGKQVYAVNFQGQLTALSIETGEKRWTRPASSFAGFALSSDGLVLSETQGLVQALDKQGKLRWEQLALQGRLLSKPLVTKNWVLVGDEEGYLHVLSLQDGAYLTRLKVASGPIVTAPKVQDGKLFVLSQGKALKAYKLIKQ